MTSLGGGAATAVVRESFGALPDGTPVDRWLLDDGTVTVAVLTYGGILQQVVVPDGAGGRADVTLGYPDLTGYLGPQPYLGALVGRYANRIAEGRFPLNGRTYQLDRNHGRHHLHGGVAGFNTRVFAAEPIAGGVRLTLTSPDGDQGYPARLDVAVEVTLAAGALTLAYTATNAEAEGGPDTIVNLTNHAYFNLAGHAAGTVGGHVVQVPADRYVGTDAELIPTGELAEVAGSALDLREPRPFAAGWDRDEEPIVNAGGYDHSWLLGGVAPGRPVLAARVSDPVSGRVLEVSTDQPAVHLYSGNMMEPLPGGKDGATYPHRGGFCAETQHLPDSPNHPGFPTTVLRPGATFTTTTTFRFTTA